MGCYKCGKQGDFAGQLCDKCFDKAEQQYENEMIEKEEKDALNIEGE